MRFGSLFSGIGGFDLGFEQAGLSCSWQVEIDGDCNRVLEKHWSGVEKHDDVRSVGQLEPVDIICGGFPCQDLSVAGQRKGLAGERSGLWFEFLRIVGLNKPRWVVIENVPGLLSSDEHRDFAAILRGLVECGYCIAWRVCDAQFYGVAQRRRRVFIVGSLGDGSCAEILFESESVSWNPPTRREAGARVTPILEIGARTNSNGQRDGDGIGIEGDPMFTLQSGKQHGVAATIKQRGRGACDEVMDNLQVTHSLRSEGADASEDGTGRGTPLVVQPGYIHPRQMRGSESSNQVGIKPDADVTDALTQEGPGAVMVSVDLQNTRLGGDVAGSLDTTRPSRGGGQAVIAFAQNTRDEVRIQGDGKISGALSNQPGMKQQTYIAFSSKDHGADEGEIAPTLRSQNFDKSHINGGGQVAIAFGWNKSESQTMRVDDEATDALQASSTSNPAIAFTERTRAEGRTFEAQEELAYAVTNPGSGGRTHSRQVAGGFGVRRLTPRECERLQSFPDDWTLYDADGKQISDSARYRMLGNAVCVNVARWIGNRLIAFA